MKSITRAWLLLLASVLATPSFSNAAGQEAVERRQPLQELIRTEVVYPQEKGELQVAIGSLFDHGRASDSLAIPVGVEYGLTDAWQVGIEWVSFRHRRSPGSAATATGELAFGTKYSFMNMGGSRAHAAVGLEAGLPTGAGATGEGRRGREVEPFAVFAVDLDRRGLQVFGHVGLSFEAGVGGDQGGQELQWNAGGLLPLGAVTIATEINVRNDAFTVRDVHELYVTPSVTFRPRRSWEIGVGLPLGLTAGANRVGLALLMTYER